MNTDSTLSCARQVVMLGSGGHAKVLSDALLGAGILVKGIVDPYFSESNEFWRQVPVVGSDDDLLNLNSDEVVLVNGIGSIPSDSTRKRLYVRFKKEGFQFLNVIHPSAVLGTGVELGEGAQVMAGVIVQTDTKIGHNCIINTGSRVDHDCLIGCNVHIAPGVVVSGGVSIGDDAHIGTGAIIVQGVSIGAGAIVGAGTVVLKDVPEHHKLLGHAPRPPIKLDSE